MGRRSCLAVDIIFWKVPNQYIQMLKSISGGDPLSQANSEVSRSLNEWAGIIGKKPNPADHDNKKSRGILGIWSR